MGKILYAEQAGTRVLKFVGDVRLTLGPTIATFLEKLKACDNYQAMIIDLSETITIDSTALGLIAKVGICTREEFGSSTCIVSPNEDVTRVLHSMAMEDVCLVTNDAIAAQAELSELPQEVASEDALREQVLDAHKVLMSLNTENEDKFRDLVEALESEKKPETKIASNG